MRKILIWIVLIGAMCAVGYRYYSITQPVVVQMQIPTQSTASGTILPDALPNPFDASDEETGTFIYTGYTQSGVQQALADHKKVVLFFFASRCPACRQFDTELTQPQTTLPDDIAVFKVNYDTAQELKQDYNIKIHHTLVYIDVHYDAVAFTVDNSVAALLDLIN